MAVVLGRVLQCPEAAHGEAGDGPSGELGNGAEGGVHPGDELVDVEGLPVPGPGVGGDRVAVPAGRAAVGHDNDEFTPCGQVPDALVVEGPEVGADAASVEEVEHRVVARGVVTVGQQHVDGRVGADGRSGEPVVLHPAAVLVLDDVQAGGLGGRRSGDGHSGAHGGEGGGPTHSLEHAASVDRPAAHGARRALGRGLI